MATPRTRSQLEQESAGDYKPKEVDPRVRQSGERTLLAWIRTALAMMGFGFVVARFGLFLRELAAASHTASTRSTGISLSIGMALVVLGVVLSVAAGIQHLQFLRRLDAGQPYQAPRYSLAVIVSFVLAVVGAGLAGYLLFRR